MSRPDIHRDARQLQALLYRPLVVVVAMLVEDSGVCPRPKESPVEVLYLQLPEALVDILACDDPCPGEKAI
ncbi:hypothetical protein GCM10023317_88180 [Actinopolymorpha pittospori]|uniref:Uncharacterized protein n=1 Tax=Actinopolymorpha pittospori TaxID=648752 RepID=A0A927N0X5_9ACTN|nr:hypothetical protein [Actinopolymorpha pittospori]